MFKRMLCAAACMAVAAPVCAQQQSGWTPPSDPALVARARAIHERVMTLDTHVDISANEFRAEDTVNFARGVPRRQVDLPKMEAGGLDAVFLAVYVGQGPLTPEGYANAYSQAVAKFDAIKRLAEVIAPNRVGMALTAADARRIYASGRKVVFAGIENGYPIGTDLGRVKEFYDRGGRYMSLSHNGNAQAQGSQLSDANTGERAGYLYNNGLSPLGRQVIAEMNKYGMMVDFSHPSKGAMMEMLRLTKAPIIGSHSGVRGVCNHSRNADDEQLRALARNRGVIQLVAFASYVKCDPVADSMRTAATTALNAEFGVVMPSGRGGGGGARGGGGGGGGRGGAQAGGGGGRGRGGNPVLDSILNTLPEDRRNAYRARQAEIATKYPPTPRATVSDFVDHIDYAKKLIGVDYLGISSDFDGGGGVDGWNSATETFNVTLEMVKRGYTEAEIEKIWSGNLLRVLEECERVARDIQAGRVR